MPESNFGQTAYLVWFEGKLTATIRFSSNNWTTGIHTVCVVRDKISGAKMTYLVNVAHKLNLKLGGINHKLPSDALGILDDGDTMVVGVDVTHPTSNSMENSPSIVGMVASTDNIFAQWPGNIRIQESRQEIQKRRQERKKATGGDDIPPDKEDMVNNIDILLGERLHVFETKNKKYPRNILIYRDGKRLRQVDVKIDR